MKHKICMLLIFAFCFMPTICKAKSIEINREFYDVNSILEKDNFIYDPNNDTLILNNANVSIVKTEENLKIILEGDNYINNDFTNLIGIYAKNLEITGNGNLTISTNETAMYATSIKIYNTNININSEKSNFTTLNGNIVIDNSIITSSSNGPVFNPVNHDVYLNNSSLLVEKSSYIINGLTFNTYINDSNIIVLECSKLGHTFRNVYVNGNSNIYIHSLKNEVPCSRYIIDENMIILESSDNLTYNEVINLTDKPNYLRIINKDYNNQLINLQQLEEELNKKQQYLNDYQKELEEKLNELNLREEELNFYEEQLNLYLDDIDEQKQILENNQISFEEEINCKNQLLLEKLNELNIREEKLSLVEESLNNLEKKLNNQINIINEKERDLNNFEQELEEENIKKEKEIKMQYNNNQVEKDNLINMQNKIYNLKENLKIKEEELSNKEKYLLKLENTIKESNDDKLKVLDNKQKNEEVLKDDFLESSNEITNQRFSSLKNIFIVLLPLLGGGLTFIFFKKRRIIHG